MNIKHPGHDFQKGAGILLNTYPSKSITFDYYLSMFVCVPYEL